VAKTYATFWKCALQVNTFSYNAAYRGATHGLSEDGYNKSLAKRCIANGISVVGIADHGSVEHLNKARKSLEAAGIVVLPGFEIASTEKVHMVCLYPQGTDIGTLNQNLGQWDSRAEDRGRHHLASCA
jgi:predicted metal-dependent phosphoesterase TrpH